MSPVAPAQANCALGCRRLRVVSLDSKAKLAVKVDRGGGDALEGARCCIVIELHEEHASFVGGLWEIEVGGPGDLNVRPHRVRFELPQETLGRVADVGPIESRDSPEDDLVLEGEPFNPDRSSLLIAGILSAEKLGNSGVKGRGNDTIKGEAEPSPVIPGDRCKTRLVLDHGVK